MNYEFFLAKRIIGSKAYKSSVSAPIIKIGIAAIAIGIIVMMIAIATGVGLQQKIRDKVVAFNGHVTITSYDTNNSQESLTPISKNEDFYPDFNTVEGIGHVQGVASKFGVIRTETDFEGVYLKGVGTDYKWDYFKEFLIAGRLPNFNDQDKWSEEVLISQHLANRLKLEVGNTLQMVFAKKDVDKIPNIITYTVVGIYNSGFQELDAQYLIGDIRHLQRINKWRPDQVGNFEVFINDYSKLEEKGAEIHDNIASLLDSKTITDKYYSIFEWINIFDKNIYGIIGIMILVAGINMITALLVLILERTRMIGILKTLGSSNWSIRKFFIYKASYLILLGLFWGNILGLGLLFTQKYFKIFPLDPKVYYVSEAPVYISFNYIFALNISTLFLCLLMLLIPSYIITKIAPVKAIRFN